MLRLLVAALACVAVLPATASAVVGGRPTTLPFLVTDGGCTGTLVAPDRVLTAAHCVEGADPANESWRLGAVAARTGRPVKVTGVSSHPDWVPIDRQAKVSPHDIAVLRLFPPVTDVAPAPLATAAPAPGTAAVIAGWGATKYDDAPSRVPLEGDVALAAPPVCARWFDPLPQPTLCVSKPGVSPCQGDSGGPLLVAGAVAGVFSFLERCGERGDPSVYTDVAAELAFLRAPTWAPIPRGGTRTRRTRTTLTCVAPAFIGRVDRVRYRWYRSGRWTPVLPTARSGTRRITAADRGRRLECEVVAANAGGFVRPRPSRPVRVPRA